MVAVVGAADVVVVVVVVVVLLLVTVISSSAFLITSHLRGKKASNIKPSLPVEQTQVWFLNPQLDPSLVGAFSRAFLAQAT